MAKLDPHKLVRKLYKRLFATDFPKGWRIHFNINGLCDHTHQQIYLKSSPQDVFSTEEGLTVLIHELLHLHEPQRPHGAAFQHKIDSLVNEVLQEVR